jgi:hypothetical protein
MTRALIFTMFAVAACGGNTSAPAADASVDGAVVFDARMGVDAQSFAGVECGLAPTATCLAPDGVCCVASGGDKCVAPQTLCNGERVQCDGAEDCRSGEVCCWLQGHGSLCTQAGMCGGGDEVMCHPGGPPTCGGSMHCCDLGGGPVTSVYGVCSAGPCPAA